MNWPSLSIIVPSYNQGKYIERTLLSILRQSYEGDLQIIVSDGGSTDETVDVLKKYPQVTWWSEQDKGFVDAVNKASKVVTGEVVAIQSSDDFYLQNAFVKALQVLTNEPEISFVTGSEIRLDEHEALQYGNLSFATLLNPGALLFQYYVPQHCTFVRQSALQAVNGLRQEVDRCADYDLWYRVLHLYKGRIIPEYLAAYQIHPLQRSQSQAELWINAHQRMIETCQDDDFYKGHYQPTVKQKEEFLLLQEIHWNTVAGGKEGAQKAQSTVNNLLKHPQSWSPHLLSFARHYLQPSRFASWLQSIKSNPFLRSALGKTNIQNKPLPDGNAALEVDINWWKQ